MAIKAAVEEQKAAVSKLVAAKSMTEALKASLADPPVKTKDLEIKVCWLAAAPHSHLHAPCTCLYVGRK